MTSGLIVKKPFAELIINGEKEWELRSRRPPPEKLGMEMYLLSSGMALGKIKIGSHWMATKQNLEQNQDKHRSEVSCLSRHHTFHVWEIRVVKKFERPKRYVHPTGARVWIKNVSFSRQPSIPNFI